MRTRTTIAACCLLAACGGGTAARDNENVMNASVPDAPPAPGAMEVMPTPASTPTGSPTAIAAPSVAGAAVTVIDAYYHAIDAHDYAKAYKLWRGDGEASEQSFDQFKHGFANTRSTTVATGTPTDPEGAAGSVYITIPVTVSSITTKGKEQRFAGNYVMRRANDVPGASAEDRKWHIHSASLHSTK